MRGISQRSTITPQNWTMYLSERLKQRWRMSREWDPPPFAPRRNREAMEYSVLPLTDRCADSQHCILPVRLQVLVLHAFASTGILGLIKVKHALEGHVLSLRPEQLVRLPYCMTAATSQHCKGAECGPAEFW